MKKENIKNLLLAIVVLFVLVLVIWNTIALNEIRTQVRWLRSDTAGLESDIASLGWDLGDMQKQLNGFEGDLQSIEMLLRLMR